MQQLASKVVFNTTIEESFTPIRIETIFRRSVCYLGDSLKTPQCSLELNNVNRFHIGAEY